MSSDHVGMTSRDELSDEQRDLLTAALRKHTAMRNARMRAEQLGVERQAAIVAAVRAGVPRPLIAEHLDISRQQVFTMLSREAGNH